MGPLTSSDAIYLDANATSSLRPEARSAVLSLLEKDSEIKNPSSVHRGGRAARKLLNDSRAQVLSLLTGNPNSKAKLFFTSGGTESCNTLVHAFLGGDTGHIVTSAIEHSAVLKPIAQLESRGYSVTKILPQRDGRVSADEFVSAVRKDTGLVALMTANNETGAIQPIVEIATLLRKGGYSGAIISDFTQAVWKTTITAEELFRAGVDAICATGHKVGALKGAGVIVLSDSICREFQPLLLGGSQEESFRSGTENLLAIASFGAVGAALAPRLEEEVSRMRELRELLWSTLKNQLPNLHRITPTDTDTEIRSLSNTLHLEVPGCRGDDLVVALDLSGVACSTGSACHSGKQGASPVMQAMGLSRDVVRLSLDWNATEELVRRGAEIVTRVVTVMREKGCRE